MALPLIPAAGAVAVGAALLGAKKLYDAINDSFDEMMMKTMKWKFH